MGRWVDVGKELVYNNSNSNVRDIRLDSLNKAIVKKQVTIPMYFYNIIVPQLGDYFENYPVDFDNKKVACCPLHDEDTPSFRFYEETNSFYCFGCQKGGDVIWLHMHFSERMNGTMPSMEEAVNFLFNYFIKGRETETFINNSINDKSEESEVNNSEELIKYNIYRTNLEKSILIDKQLDREIKEQLWLIMDEIDCLIDKDFIKGADAINYIKSKVKELTVYKNINQEAR